MTRKRRFCAECRLIEPAEGWTNGECPACAWRKDYVAPERKTRCGDGRRNRSAATIAKFVQSFQAKFVPGLCSKCRKVKPLDMFPPRQAHQPAWRPHDYRCKACVCESVMETQWRRRRLEFIAELKTMSADELGWQMKTLGRRVRLVREELKSREGER